MSNETNARSKGGTMYRIKEYREKLGISQYELARRAGLKSKDTVCRLENNEDVDVTGKNLLAIARALGVTAEELYGTGDD